MSMLQHVIDPLECIGCSACEMACASKAITNIAGRYCIDFDLCNDCKKCVRDCPTGACDVYIETENVFTIDAQAMWTALPTL
ncbi:MAG: 4Fe-4S binding protein [Candidatus Melainabacteria bacterium]|nr:4Fe-4S binding protein [Candidatus Melainabacteria bacterium]